MNIEELGTNVAQTRLVLPTPRKAPTPRLLKNKHRAWASDVGFVLLEPQELEAACKRINKVFLAFVSNPTDTATTDKVGRLLKCQFRDVGGAIDLVMWVLQNVVQSGQYAVHRIRKLKASCSRIIHGYRQYKLYHTAMIIGQIAKWDSFEKQQRSQDKMMSAVRRASVMANDGIDSDFYFKWVPEDLKLQVVEMIYTDRLKKWKESFKQWQKIHGEAMATFRAQRAELLQAHEKRKLMGACGGDVEVHMNISILEKRIFGPVPPKPSFVFRPSQITVDEMIQITYQMQRINHMTKVFDKLGAPEQSSAVDTVNFALSRRLSIAPPPQPPPQPIVYGTSTGDFLSPTQSLKAIPSPAGAQKLSATRMGTLHAGVFAASTFVGGMNAATAGAGGRRGSALLGRPPSAMSATSSVSPAVSPIAAGGGRRASTMMMAPTEGHKRRLSVVATKDNNASTIIEHLNRRASVMLVSKLEGSPKALPTPDPVTTGLSPPQRSARRFSASDVPRLEVVSGSPRSNAALSPSGSSTFDQPNDASSSGDDDSIHRTHQTMPAIPLSARGNSPHQGPLVPVLNIGGPSPRSPGQGGSGRRSTILSYQPAERSPLSASRRVSSATSSTGSARGGGSGAGSREAAITASTVVEMMARATGVAVDNLGTMAECLSSRREKESPLFPAMPLHVFGGIQPKPAPTTEEPKSEEAGEDSAESSQTDKSTSKASPEAMPADDKMDILATKTASLESLGSLQRIESKVASTGKIEVSLNGSMDFTRTGSVLESRASTHQFAALTRDRHASSIRILPPMASPSDIVRRATLKVSATLSASEPLPMLMISCPSPAANPNRQKEVTLGQILKNGVWGSQPIEEKDENVTNVDGNNDQGHEEHVEETSVIVELPAIRPPRRLSLTDEKKEQRARRNSVESVTSNTSSNDRIDSNPAIERGDSNLGQSKYGAFASFKFGESATDLKSSSNISRKPVRNKLQSRVVPLPPCSMLSGGSVRSTLSQKQNLSSAQVKPLQNIPTSPQGKGKTCTLHPLSAKTPKVQKKGFYQPRFDTSLSKKPPVAPFNSRWRPANLFVSRFGE